MKMLTSLPFKTQFYSKLNTEIIILALPTWNELFNNNQLINYQTD